jgi:RNase adaptor protein for sRNA GlmZ degradation
MEHAEHGGGYIFDCRALPNPGRLFEFKDMNGFDTPVIDYFAKHPEVEQYLDTIKITINQSVEAYLKRGFCYLSIAFGCTGGQHRSVYMANRLAQWAEQLDGVRVKLFHRELNIRI